MSRRTGILLAVLVFLAFELARGLRCTPAGGVEYRFGRRIGSWE